jgi:hypothetical protein
MPTSPSDGLPKLYVKFGAGRVEAIDYGRPWPVGARWYRVGEDGPWEAIPERELPKTAWPSKERYAAFYASGDGRKYAEARGDGRRNRKAPPAGRTDQAGMFLDRL